jgi:N-acetylglucosaminyldiphosphoundecaprenol N-acetyl-beta-D-mannosaminyltransferase
MAWRENADILGVHVDNVDLPGALVRVREWLGEPRSLNRVRHVVTVNPEFVMAARRDPVFAQVLAQADLATADGIGIVLAGRMLGVPVGPRVTGVELTEGLAGLRHPEARLFLLGAGPGVAAQAADRLRERFPGIEIVGTLSGSPEDAAFEEIERQLHAARPTILLVAFGHPRQDLWIARHRDVLARHGILVAIGVGGTFDYLSGRVPRAPRWLRRVGLEWLYRLARQPWRWRRQLALPHFVLLVARERIARVLTSRRGHDS